MATSASLRTLAGEVADEWLCGLCRPDPVVCRQAFERLLAPIDMKRTGMVRTAVQPPESESRIRPIVRTFRFYLGRTSSAIGPLWLRPMM